MKPKIYSQSVHKEILTFYLAGLKLTIDNNLTEVDQNVEERFELSETESNRHQNEKSSDQVFDVSFDALLGYSNMRQPHVDTRKKDRFRLRFSLQVVSFIYLATVLSLNWLKSTLVALNFYQKWLALGK